MKLLFAAIAAFVLLLLWRRWRQRHRATAINSFPYAGFLDQRLAQRRPELSEAQRAEVLAGLQDYFHLCRSAGRRIVAMPSQVVDDAWHEFILFTRHYQKFCRLAFGRFLHHTPAEAMRSPTDAGDGIKRAWRLACAREGIDPQNPSRLPRLFALDAQFGIAGGFVYSLNCMALGASGNGSYCASHIGCSSGCSGDSGSSDSDGGGDGGGGGCGGD